ADDHVQRVLRAGATGEQADRLAGDFDLRRRSDLRRPGSVGLVPIAPRLEMREAAMQSRGGPVVARLHVALDRAAPRSPGGVDLAQAPLGLGPRRPGLGALAGL